MEVAVAVTVRSAVDAPRVHSNQRAFAPLHRRSGLGVAGRGRGDYTDLPDERERRSLVFVGSNS